MVLMALLSVWGGGSSCRDDNSPDWSHRGLVAGASLMAGLLKTVLRTRALLADFELWLSGRSRLLLAGCDV